MAAKKPGARGRNAKGAGAARAGGMPAAANASKAANQIRKAHQLPARNGAVGAINGVRLPEQRTAP